MNGAQSVRRAALLLRILASAPEHRLSELSRSSGLTPPTVRRLLQNLMVEGFVQQNPLTRRYYIGEELAMIAMARPFRPPIVAKADLHMRGLAAEIGDATFLTIYDRYDTLCIARYIGTFPIQVISVDVGARRPLGVSSAGFAILSDFSMAKSEAILRHNELRLAPYGTDLRSAMKRLSQARDQGYSVNNAGLSIGTKTVSVPIPATKRTPSAALTVVAIHRRLSVSRIPEVVEILRRAADKISSVI